MACQFLRLFLVEQSAAEGTSSLKSCAEWSHFMSCNFRVFAVVGGYERNASLFLSTSHCTPGSTRVRMSAPQVQQRTIGSRFGMQQALRGRFSGLGGGGVDQCSLPHPDIKVPANPETVLDFGTSLPYTQLQIISSRIKAQKCAPYSIPASFNYLHLLHL